MSQRTRWGGVYLGESQRDRAIAAWLDEVADDPHINVSELVKDYLYRLATGQEPPADQRTQALADMAAEITAYNQELTALRRALKSGAYLPSQDVVDDDDVEGAAEIRNALMIDD